MQIILKRHEKMLLELLRSALNSIQASSTIFEEASDTDWEACYHLSIEQGVMALAWDGIVTLPSNLLPPKGLKVIWALAVEKYEKRYLVYCKTATDITELFGNHGIKTFVLKGVGFSHYYPNPNHREGGDIDIYTSSADQKRLSDTEANALANELMRRMHKEVTETSDKHSLFYYNNIPIENHRTYVDVHEWELAIPLEKILRTMDSPHEINVFGNTQKISVPGEQFNVLFIAFHAMQHYGAGLCLHHLCDWVCVLNRTGLTLPKGDLDRRFVDFIAILTAFANHYLGTNIPVDYSQEKLEKMVNYMFRTPYKENSQPKNLFKVIIYKTKHFFYYRRIISDFIGQIPVSYRISKTLARIFKTPNRLIKIKKEIKM